MTTLRHLANRIDVGLLELGILPGSRAEHLSCELRLKLSPNWLIVGSFGHFVGLLRHDVHELPLLELVNHLFIVAFKDRGCKECAELLFVLVFKFLRKTNDFVFFVTCDLHPLVLHRFGEADFGQLSANLRLNITLEDLNSDFKGGGVLELGGASISVALTFGGKLDLSSLDNFEHDVLVDEQTL